MHHCACNGSVLLFDLFLVTEETKHCLKWQLLPLSQHFFHTVYELFFHYSYTIPQQVSLCVVLFVIYLFVFTATQISFSIVYINQRDVAA